MVEPKSRQVIDEIEYSHELEAAQNVGGKCGVGVTVKCQRKWHSGVQVSLDSHRVQSLFSFLLFAMFKVLLICLNNNK
jgi:hypothetical protein